MARILLAEDDQDTRFILNQILNEAGHEVRSLDEGSKIVNGQVEAPDLFILDQQMPTIDGLALSKYLKVHEETRDIPIIMISAYPETERRARMIGVSEFLSKPFESKNLLVLVERHTNNSK